MKIAIVSFTKDGSKLSVLLKKRFIDEGNEALAYVKSQHVDFKEIISLKENLKDWVKRMFPYADALIFIGACGIAVRSIAPFVKSKKEDPAVLVLDEQGKFCISLLSGHIGGANELCEKISDWVGARAVITTATDIQGKFAVDVFAGKNKLHISNMTYAKEVSARLVAGKPTFYLLENGIYLSKEEKQTLKVQGMWEYKEGICKEEIPLGVYIGIYRKKSPFLHTLYLTPAIVTAGIGCRRNTKQSQIANFMEQTFFHLGISFHAIKGMASIDLKKDEEGLLSYCETYHLPLSFYSKEELKAVEGKFTSSAFVSSITGVDNVCERSAKKASEGGCFIQRKITSEGVTLALAVKELKLRL